MPTLQDAVFANARLNSLYSLSIGRLYTWQVVTSILSGGNESISFTTADDPVHISNVVLQVSGTEEADIEVFSGGASSSGGIINPGSNNDFIIGPSPYLNNEIRGAVIIDVVGTRILLASVLADRQTDTLIESDNGGLLLRPNRHYYITLNNRGAQTEAIIITVQAGLG